MSTRVLSDRKRWLTIFHNGKVNNNTILTSLRKAYSTTATSNNQESETTTASKPFGDAVIGEDKIKSFAEVEEEIEAEVAASVTTEVTEKERKDSLLQSYVEFCFSDANLSKMKLTSFYSYISLDHVLAEPYIKQLGVKEHNLKEAINNSPHLEYSEEKNAVKRTDPITEITEDTAQFINWKQFFRSQMKAADMRKALNIFFTLENLPPIQNLDAAIIRCGELHDLESAQNIMEGLTLREKEPLISHFVAYAQAHVSCGDFDGGMQILDSLQHDGFKPTLKMWTSFINSICKNGDIGNAMMLFEFMKKTGVQPDPVTYIVLLKNCGVSDREQIDLLLNELNEKGMVETVHYSYKLKMLKDMVAVEESKRLIAEMKEKGTQPNEKSYEIYFDTLAKAGAIDYVYQALEEYDELFEKRTHRVYSSVLFCCFQVGDLPEAQRFAEAMKADGHALGRSQFHCLLGIARKIDPLYTQQLFEEMKENGFVDTLAYNLVILMHAKKGNFEGAQNVFDELLAQSKTSNPNPKLVPDNTTYSSMIYAKGMSSNVKEAEEYMKELIKTHNYIPDAYTLNQFLNVAVCTMPLEKALSFFLAQFEGESVLGIEVEPDTVSFGTMLHGCVKAENYNELWDLFHLMQTNYGVVPDEIIFQIMLNGCEKSGDTKRVNKVLEHMEALGYRSQDIRLTQAKEHRGSPIAAKLEEEFFATGESHEDLDGKPGKVV